MKALLLSLMLYIGLSTTAQAYEKGETVWAAYACTNEDSMIQVVEADVLNIKAAQLMMRSLFSAEECKLVQPPGQQVIVEQVIIEYEDSEGIASQLLSIKASPEATRLYYLIVTLDDKESI